MIKTYFNPGCALSLYKPDIEKRVLDFLSLNYKKTALHKICCKHDPALDAGSLIINVCAGCDKRFGNLYQGISTLSLWETLDSLETFPFPDYNGLTMTLHDPCPVRKKPQIHKAVRNLLKKMNITIMETEFHGTQSMCCGDSYYPKLPVESIQQKMRERADSMPCKEVVVYCVSCIKSIYIGGKTPRHLIDLLMAESTEPQVYDTEKWHKILQDYIDAH